MAILFLLLFLALTAIETIYLFVFVVAARLGRLPVPATPARPYTNRIAVMLPAYKEDMVIIDSAQQALLQDYPRDAYDVIIIADSLKPTTLEKLATLPVQVLEVSFDVSTKAKALNDAMSRMKAQYDIALVLDADNVMAPDFLTQINMAFNAGWKAIQGHRVAKNINTSVAILDAVSEEVNTYIFRRGHRILGLSASLMGSGMGFDYALFKNYMSQIDTTGGFDKELEMRLILDRIPINYLEDALCYDEKVQNSAVFERQRTRWIAAQMKYLRKNFMSGVMQLFKGNIDYFDKVFMTLLFPRVILLGFLGIAAILSLLTASYSLFLVAVAQLMILLLSFYLATPASLLQRLTFKEISQVPGLFLRFLRATTRIGEASKSFINTPHTTTSEVIN